MSKKKKKTQSKPTDVIIVGAGIAGSVLAFHLATAKRVNVKYFQTYDIDKLTKYAELTKLTIEAPKSNVFAFPIKNNNE